MENNRNTGKTFLICFTIIICVFIVTQCERKAIDKGLSNGFTIPKPQ